MVPLQAALAARHGSLLGAVTIAAALPIARRLAKKVSPT
jgi:4-hydroxybenzoate polyprenyltransferase